MTGYADCGEGRIVVGVDGTTASARAVRWAIREALLRQAILHLVFADDHEGRSRASYSGCQLGAPQSDEDKAAGTGLLAAEQLVSQALPPGRFSSERADGSAARVLIDRSAGAELLVLGSAYSSGPARPSTMRGLPWDPWRERACTVRHALW